MANDEIPRLRGPVGRYTPCPCPWSSPEWTGFRWRCPSCKNTIEVEPMKALETVCPDPNCPHKEPPTPQPDPRCICDGRPLLIHIPPGQHIHCPVHPDNVIRGPAMLW